MIYKILLVLYVQGLDDFVVEKLVLECGLADLSEWIVVVDVQLNLQYDIILVMVGKYMDLVDVYKLFNELLLYVGICICIKVNIEYVDLEDFECDGIDVLKKYDVILVFGGFGKCGIEGKIVVVCYVCEYYVFYLGICFGMQVVVIEYVCDMVGLVEVYSMEFDEGMSNLVVGFIIEWCNEDGFLQQWDLELDLGGIMCLGVQECCLVDDSLSCKFYGKDVVFECYCYCYEVNNKFVFVLEEVGFKVVGCLMDGLLVEMIEVFDYLWFVVC